MRKSNFELLRIVCMLFIVLHHFIVHGLKATGYWADDTIIDYVVFFNSCLIVAVNCFILVSGYFGIHPSWKGFLRLYLMCVFYQFLHLILQKDFSNIYTAFLPFSHSNGLWFIPQYFFLWLISPMLNKVIDGLQNNKRAFLVLLLFYGAFVFYFGWWFSNLLHLRGYSVLSFIFLYLIGRFIFLHTATIGSKRKYVYLFLYLLFSLATALIVKLMLITNHIVVKGFAYNSPFVIAATVSLFLFFRNLNFTNKTINWLASSALAVYLISDNLPISYKLYSYVNSLGITVDNGVLLALYLFGLAVAVVLVCLLIDKVRMLITNPIEKLLNKIPVEKYLGLGVSKLSNLIK